MGAQTKGSRGTYLSNLFQINMWTMVIKNDWTLKKVLLLLTLTHELIEEFRRAASWKTILPAETWVLDLQ